MSYGKCFVCGKEVSDLDDKILFGYDGDFIHAKCKPKLEKEFKRIDSMSDSEFADYIRGGN